MKPTISIRGFVVYVADHDGFVVDWKLANRADDEVTLFITDETGMLELNTTVIDMPRLAKQFGYKADYQEVTFDIRRFIK